MDLRTTAGSCRFDHFGDVNEMGGDTVQRSCETCKHHLGAGTCRINLEDECGAGEFEAWEAAESEMHGKWIITEYEYFTCSLCGGSYDNGADCTKEAEKMLRENDVYMYCPHCGAQMREG